MTLIVFFSSSTSPLTLTVIFFERSPFATAVVTSAMLRTWVVRLFASVFTLSVRSFHTPETSFTSAWPPSWPSVPTSFATRVTSAANVESWSTIVLIVSFSSRTSPRTSTVIFFERSPFATAVVTSAMLRTWPVRFDAIEFTLSVRPFHVPLTPFDLRLAAEDALGADLARDARHLGGERAQLVDHDVDRLGELRHLALRFEDELLVEVAVRDRGDDARDAAHLRRQVGRHEVHVVGEVLPDAADALDLRLAAEDALGADLARDARHLRRERTQLVDHRR